MNRLNFFVPLTAVLLLSACSSINTVLGWVGIVHNNDLVEVTIESSADSNNNNPVAFDLVFVMDKAPLAILSGLSGPQWFQQKAAMQLKYANQISVLSGDAVPLTLPTKALTLPDNSRDAQGVLMFANYLAPAGQVVASLQDYDKVKVRFERDKYQLLRDDN